MIPSTERVSPAPRRAPASERLTAIAGRAKPKIRSSLRPMSTTSSSLMNSRVMGPPKIIRTTPAAVMNTKAMRALEMAAFSERSGREAPRPCPTRVVAATPRANPGKKTSPSIRRAT